MSFRPHLTTWLTFTFIVLACSPFPTRAATIYVNASANGANNGGSWADALRSLEDALASAGLGDEIWVATGTYRPENNIEPPDPRAITFLLPDGVAIYGGFAGHEVARDERDWNANETILSGDIAGDDLQEEASNCCLPHDGAGCDQAACELQVCELNPACCTGQWDYPCVASALQLCNLCSGVGNASDNSYHVLTALNNVHGSILDGFTITSGYAFGEFIHNAGGGMRCQSASPTIRNCTFVRNSAYAGAGAFHNFAGSPVFENCKFVANYCQGNGAAFATGTTPNVPSSPHFQGCLFKGNFSIGASGIYATGPGDITVVDSVFEGNRAALVSGAIAMNVDEEAEGHIINCIFRNNWAGAYGGALGTNNIGVLWATNCIFTGNQSSRGGALTDSGTAVLFNCTLASNSAAEYGGAVFGEHGGTTIANSILWDNHDSGSNLESAQVRVHNGTPDIDFSCIQGWSGQWGGQHNTSVDPQLVDVDGIDNTIGTADDDVRLRRGSPSVDAGNNNLVTADILDLDHDADSTELTPIDFAHHERFQDDPDVADTGIGFAPIVDRGALEFGFVDCNENGIADDLDVMMGNSADCNENLIPDECENPDCILFSEPPDGSVDARYPTSTGGMLPESWRIVKLTFSDDPTPLSPGAFDVEVVPPGEVPVVESLVVDGLEVTLTLDRPIRPGAWTIITHRTSGTSAQIGFLPGDVNGDGTSSPHDILRLIDNLNSIGNPLPLWSADVNGSGDLTPADIVREIDILMNCDRFGCWLYESLPYLGE